MTSVVVMVVDPEVMVADCDDPEVMDMDEPEIIADDEPVVIIVDFISDDDEEEEVVSVLVSMRTSELELECSTWDISEEEVTIISPFMTTCASPLS